MTTTSTQSKWGLIGVRVCAVYLAVIAVAYPMLVLISVSNGTFTSTVGLLLLIFIPGAILFGLTALKLWALRSWARAFASEIFISHILVLVYAFINLLTASLKLTLGGFLILTIWVMIGIIGWIFLCQPAVKALFENQSYVDFF